LSASLEPFLLIYSLKTTHYSPATPTVVSTSRLPKLYIIMWFIEANSQARELLSGKIGELGR